MGCILRKFLIGVVLPASLIAAAAMPARSQVTYGANLQIASGFNAVASISSDVYGNLYVMTLDAIYRFPIDSSGQYTSYSTVVSGLTFMNAIAVDSSQNIYLLRVKTVSANTFDSTITYFRWNGSSYDPPVERDTGIAVAYPFTVAPGGTVAFVNALNGAVFYGSFKPFSSGTWSLVEAHWTNPNAMWMDPNDNIFYVDPYFGLNIVDELKSTGGNTWASVSIAVSDFSLGNTVLSITGDSFSNVYVADVTNNDISEIAATNSTQGNESTVLNLTEPDLVASNRFGDLFYSVSGSGAVDRFVRYPAIDFGRVPVGSTSYRPLYVTVNASAPYEALTDIATRVLAPAGPDFTLLNSPQCSNTSTSTYTCVLPVLFTPSGPGLRSSAVQVVNSGGQVTNVYLSGWATGPRAAFGFSPVVIGSAGTSLNGVTLHGATGVVADTYGNIFVADPQGAQIVRYVRTGAGTYIGAPLALNGLILNSDGLNYLAIDGAGNLYTDQGTSAVKISYAYGSYNSAPLNTHVALGAISGLYADGYGTLHISDNVNGQIVMVPALGVGQIELSRSGAEYGGLASTPGPTIGIFLPTVGLGRTTTVDSKNKQILSATFPIGFGADNGFDLSPTQLALDSSFNAFVEEASLLFADENTSAYYLRNWNTGAFQPLPFTATAGCAPSALIQTMQGDYVGTSKDCGTVTVYPALTSTSLSFAPAEAGTTSSDSPKTMTIWNTGSDNLNFSSIASGADFPVDDSGTGSTCSTSSAVAPDSFCTLTIEFSPAATAAAGLLSEQVSLTDNSLNATGAVQSISVSGTATTQPPALTAPTGTSALSGSTAFTWDPGAGSTYFHLRIGINGVGSSNLYDSGNLAGSVTSKTVNIPANDLTLYVRLSYLLNGTWHWIDYTFAEAGSPAPPTLTAPASTSGPLSGATTFTWNPGAGSKFFHLRIGILGPSYGDIYDSGNLLGSVTSEAVTVPANGVKLFVRLSYYSGGIWQWVDYTFTEAGTPTPPALTAPTGAGTLSGSTAFTWNPGTGSTRFRLKVGTAGPGSFDIYDSGNLLSSVTSEPATIPANGATVFVQLAYIVNGVVQQLRYTFTEAGTATPPTLTAPTSSLGPLSGPTPFSWDPGAGSTLFNLKIGTLGPGSTNIYQSGAVANSVTSETVTIPSNGATIYVQLGYLVDGVWHREEYTFTEAP